MENVLLRLTRTARPVRTSYRKCAGIRGRPTASLPLTAVSALTSSDPEASVTTNC